MVKTSVKRTPVNKIKNNRLLRPNERETRNERRRKERLRRMRETPSPVRKARTVINTKYKAGALNRVKRTQAKYRATKNNGARTMFNNMKTTRLAAKTGFRVNSKRVTLKLKPKVVKALKDKSINAVLAAANVPSRFRRALNPLVPKIKRLLSGVDWQYGMIYTIVYLIAALQMLKHPRMTNNGMDFLVQGFLPDQFPRRFIGGKPPIPDPPVELSLFENFVKTFTKWWSKSYANKRVSNRAKQESFNVVKFGFKQFMATLPMNGRSMAGITADFALYTTGLILFFLAWFPYSRPGAKKLLNQIFTFIKKYDKQIYGLISELVVDLARDQYLYNTNKTNSLAPATIVTMLFNEGIKFAPHVALAVSTGSATAGMQSYGASIAHRVGSMAISGSRLGT
jgi:hypothetical protein